MAGKRVHTIGLNRPGFTARTIGVGKRTGEDPEFLWVHEEAKRRNVSISQVARDAFRAYRKLVPAAAKLTEVKSKIIAVDF